MLAKHLGQISVGKEARLNIDALTISVIFVHKQNMGVETLTFSEAFKYFKLNFVLIFLNMTNVGQLSTRDVLMTMVMMMTMIIMTVTMMMRKSGQWKCTGEILQGTSKTGGRNWTIFHSLQIHF